MSDPIPTHEFNPPPTNDSGTNIVKPVNLIPSFVVTEKATGNLRLKNGRLQMCYQVDYVDSTTNAYNIYLEWRYVDEVDESAPDKEILHQSDNWRFINEGDKS